MTRRTLLASWLSVLDKGAKGDGRTLDTAALQKAIDTASERGGAVLLPPGRYLTGTLFLRSNIELRFEPGAVLLGTPDLSRYPVTPGGFRSYTDNYTDKSLLYAENCENVSLSGPGVIDGQGTRFPGPYKVRPYLARFIACRNVSLTGLTLKDSPMWVQHYLACVNVRLSGLTVLSRVNHNNDGIDIDCSSRVRISDCDISSGDDAIVLKSTANRPTSDVTVTNCTLSTACNALKLGTESNGGFSDIVFANCTVYDTRLAGLAIESVDGGTLERVLAANLSMRNVGAPLFVRLGNRARPFEKDGPRPGIGRLRNVQVRGLEATGCGPVGCAIAGLPGHPIENLTLENLRLEFEGGGRLMPEPEELPDKYPEFKMFGPLPAYGLWFRHTRNVRLRNIELTTRAPDARPASNVNF